MRRERNIQPRKRQDFRREDNNNKGIIKIRNIELRAISIGPKPFLFFMSGVSVMLKWKAVFPWKEWVFVFIFECLPPFFSLCSPYLVSLPLFTLSLSLSLVIFLFSSLFAFFFPSLFLVSCLALVLCFCFMQRRTSRYFISKAHVYFVLLLSCFCLVFEIPFCYLCFLPWPQPLLGAFSRPAL